MEEKYYTPQIEEFYVGFEYEYLSIEDKWIKDKFNSIKPQDEEQMPFILIERTLKKCSTDLRVKYLDKEDIEECKFKYISSLFYSKEDFFKINDRYELYYNYNKYNCKIDDTDNNDSILFDGTIKNKSELIKILQMVNIK